MKTLKQCYPLVTPLMLTWFIPVAICIVLLVFLFLSVHQNEPTGIIVGLLALSVLIGGCVAGFIIQVSVRWGVRSAVVGFCDYGNSSIPRPIAFRNEDAGLGVLEFVGKLVASRYGRNLITERIEDPIRRVKPKFMNTVWEPITFVTFKPEGTVYGKTRGIEWRARGIQKGRWCEVEWNDDTKRAFSLVRHELAHVHITFNDAKMSTEDQHKLMREAWKTNTSIS